MFVEMLFWKGPKNAEYMRDGYKAMEPFAAPRTTAGLGDDDALAAEAHVRTADDEALVRGLVVGLDTRHTLAGDGHRAPLRGVWHAP